MNPTERCEPCHKLQLSCPEAGSNASSADVLDGHARLPTRPTAALMQSAANPQGVQKDRDIRHVYRLCFCFFIVYLVVFYHTDPHVSRFLDIKQVQIHDEAGPNRATLKVEALELGGSLSGKTLIDPTVAFSAALGQDTLESFAPTAPRGTAPPRTSAKSARMLDTFPKDTSFLWKHCLLKLCLLLLWWWCFFPLGRMF